MLAANENLMWMRFVESISQRAHSTKSLFTINMDDDLRLFTPDKVFKCFTVEYCMAELGPVYSEQLRSRWRFFPSKFVIT